MTAVVIIQARMGSSRLPGKVLADLAGMPVLWHVIERVRHSVLTDEIIVATTTNSEDDAVAYSCTKWNVKIFRGDPEDVLRRYYDAILDFEKKYVPLDYIVRITADCPLIDPDIIDTSIQSAVSGKFDYVSNINPPTYPDGLDVEVISRTALEDAYHNAVLESEREHVTPYIRNNMKFKKHNISNDVDFSNLRWTLDTREDLEFLRTVFGALYHYPDIFGTTEILDYLQIHPDLKKINAMNRRNEGYDKSLMEDITGNKG
jgi:spore coat polysaccharide biosynthesis protein SpsF (cytidylyltransferase family)